MRSSDPVYGDAILDAFVAYLSAQYARISDSDEPAVGSQTFWAPAGTAGRHNVRHVQLGTTAHSTVVVVAVVAKVVVVVAVTGEVDCRRPVGHLEAIVAAQR